MRIWNLLALSLAATIISCADERKVSFLNESEIFFHETLASISRDDHNDDLFYIGTEDGIVFVYSAGSQHIDTLKTEFDRIYRVKRTVNVGSEDSYWVGTRNMGLFRCRLKGDSLVQYSEHGHFYITTAQKGSKYSAYDVLAQDTSVYVATSHGLLKVPNDLSRNDTLDIIYPGQYKAQPSRLCPTVVGNIEKYDDRYLFCSCDSGLLRVDMKKGDTVQISLRDKKVWNVGIHHDSIYALTGSAIAVTDWTGQMKENIELNRQAQIYYYDEATDIHYLISDNDVQLTQDLHNYKDFRPIQLRRPVRTKCHHVIENVPGQSFSLMVTNHTISRIGHHQDILNASGNVKYACVDGDNIYYLKGTKLYRQKAGELVAYQIKDITGGTKDVRFVEILHHTLYYVDSDNRVFQSKLYGNYFLNSVLSWSDKEIEPKLESGREVTAIGKDADNVYVGVRDGFRNLKDISIEIDLHSIEGNVPVPFITRFVSCDNDKKVLLGTLNDGVYWGENNQFTKIPNTEAYTFIRDLAILPNAKDSLYILTNHYLFKQTGSVFVPTDTISGFNRLLLVNDKHVYAIKEYGIRELVSNMEYFADVQFNPNACVVHDSLVFAGSNNGIYVLKPNFQISNGREEGFDNVRLKDNNLYSKTSLLTAALLVLFFVAACWWYDRYRLGRHALRTYKDGLLIRLDELNSTRNHLPADICTKIDKLYADVEAVDVGGKKTSLNEMRKLSMEIMRQTESVPSILTNILQEQKSRIKSMASSFPEASNYMDNTDEAIKTHTILRLGSQISANDQWLDKVRTTQNKLSQYESLLATMPSIPGLTEEAMGIMSSSKTSEDRIGNIERVMSAIDSPSAVEKIKDYIKGKLNDCEKALGSICEDSAIYSVLNAIKNEYHAILLSGEKSSGNTKEILNAMLAINQRMEVVSRILSIANTLSDYEAALHLYKAKKSDIQSKAKAGTYATNEFLRGRDQKELDKLETPAKNLSKQILNNIEKLYDAMLTGPDNSLLKLLEVKHKVDGSLFMKAKVLTLLLTGTNIPVSRFKDLLECNDQRLRTAKRDIVKQINTHKPELLDYAGQNPSSFAVLVLEITNSVAPES